MKHARKLHPSERVSEPVSLATCTAAATNVDECTARVTRGPITPCPSHHPYTYAATEARHSAGVPR